MFAEHLRSRDETRLSVPPKKKKKRDLRPNANDMKKKKKRGKKVSRIKSGVAPRIQYIRANAAHYTIIIIIIMVKKNKNNNNNNDDNNQPTRVHGQFSVYAD